MDVFRNTVIAGEGDIEVVATIPIRFTVLIVGQDLGVPFVTCGIWNVDLATVEVEFDGFSGLRIKCVRADMFPVAVANACSKRNTDITMVEDGDRVAFGYVVRPVERVPA